MDLLEIDTYIEVWLNNVDCSYVDQIHLILHNISSHICFQYACKSYHDSSDYMGRVVNMRKSYHDSSD